MSSRVYVYGPAYIDLEDNEVVDAHLNGLLDRLAVLARAGR